MSEPVSDPRTSGPEEGGDLVPQEESWLSYEGATVPRFLALIWVAFLIFAVVYLLRYVPASWMEWFQ